LAPPCNRQRPFFVAGDRQGLPLLVRAPHLFRFTAKGLPRRLLPALCPCHRLMLRISAPDHERAIFPARKSSGTWGLSREASAMPVPSEPFAAIAPFARWATKRRALQEQVIFVHRGHILWNKLATTNANSEISNANCEFRDKG